MKKKFHSVTHPTKVEELAQNSAAIENISNIRKSMCYIAYHSICEHVIYQNNVVNVKMNQFLALNVDGTRAFIFKNTFHC